MIHHYRRVLGVLLVGCLYVGLFLLNLVSLRESPSSATLLWNVGISSTNGLLFLAAGTFLWLVGRRNRVLSVALSAFCLFSCMAFTLGDGSGQLIVTPASYAIAIIGEIVTPLAVFSFVLVLLLLQWRFFLARRASTFGTMRRFPFWGRCYVALLGMFTVAEMAIGVASLPHGIETAWGVGIALGFYALFLVGVITSLVVSWLSREASPRERLYHRLLMHGLILAIGPFLIFTLLPSLMNVRGASDPNGTLLFDPVITTASFCLLPIMLVYAVVRYQLLVPERTIERIMTAVIGITVLGVSCWAIIVIASQLGPGRSPWSLGLVIGSAMIAGPLAWTLAKRVAVFILSPERIYFYRLIYGDSLIDASRSLEVILQKCLVHIWRPKGAYLLLYDQDRDRYAPLERFSEGFPSQQQRLLASELRSVPGITSDERNLALQRSSPLLEHLAGPALSLRRAVGKDIVLIPFQPAGAAHTPPIAILVLGEQEQGEVYAGPDFEIFHLIRERFGPLLELALFEEQGKRHQEVMRHLLPFLLHVGEGAPLQAATSFAQAAEEAFHATVEVWLPGWMTGESLREELHLNYRQSTAPLLTCETLPLRVVKKEALFLTGEARIPLLQPAASFPSMAWLPLLHDEIVLGVVVLGWPDSYLVSSEMQELLHLFCAYAAQLLEAALAFQRLQRRQQIMQQFLEEQAREVVTSSRVFLDRLPSVASDPEQ